MSNSTANLVTKYDYVHLRDARHASQFYTANSFDMAPKVKFLYHILFQPTTEALSNSPKTADFQKQISLLAKNATLPSYASTVDTINQYNRKKKYQTKIDYKDVIIKFHDDNAGATRGLLEEYYKYYFVDGNKSTLGLATAFSSRDKFGSTVPTYGLDNGTSTPFFEFIKIFQLSRHTWSAYTLVNPIITQWSHDSVDYSEGGGTMENTINIAYEAVMYTAGSIDPNGDPAGFAASDTNYDHTPSPLTAADISGNDTSATRSLTPPISSIIAPTKYSNSASISAPISTAAPVSVAKTNNVKTLNSNTILTELTKNKSLLESLTRTAISTGTFSKTWSVSNAANYDKLPTIQKLAMQQEVLERATGTDIKMQQLASTAISNKGKIK